MGVPMKFRYRVHEWLADRISWVQYPNIRPTDDATRAASRTGPRFATHMPLGKRIDMVLLSLVTLATGLFILGAVLFLTYVVLF